MLKKYAIKKNRRLSRRRSEEMNLKIMWITDTHISAEVDGNPDAEGACGAGYEAEVGPRCYYTGRGKLAYFVDQVNDEQPDFVIHTGDAIDGNHSDEDFALFMQEWSRIDDNIPKDFCRGNHDKNPNIIEMLGYDNRSVNAGSVFNQSYTISNGYKKIRVITFNTHLSENQEWGYVGRTQGRVYTYLMDWLKSKIEEAEEDFILLLTHANPYSPDAYFGDEYSESLRVMVQSTGKTVHILGGHQHGGITDYIKHTNLKGEDASFMIGHQIPTAVNQGEKSDYGIIHIAKDGEMNVETRDLLYTP